MVIVAQLVRAPDCGSGGREFESRLSPLKTAHSLGSFFLRSRAPKNKNFNYLQYQLL